MMSMRLIAVLSCVFVEISFAFLPLRSSKDAKTPTYRTPGCKLGSEFYPLEQTWSPEMEQIDGKLHCVQCVCLPIVKKGNLQQKGRVVCRNIKDECPALTCGASAILLPNQCCKSCPGEEPFTVKDIESLVNTSPEDARAMAMWKEQGDVIREFLSLMTEKPGTKTKAAARGRFTLRYGNLHFSLQFEKMKHPKFIKIVDQQDNMLFEHEIDTIEGNMVCAVWRDIPSVYMSFLMTGKLNATLEDDDDVLSGSIIVHRALEDETFSSLLTPLNADGSGAIAMMTMTDDRKSLMFILRFADALRTSSAEFTVKFMKKKKAMKEFKSGTSSDGLEFVEMWSKLSTSRLKQLIRGRLDLVVTHNGKDILKGSITVKQTCGVYQAVLSGSATKGKSAGGAGGSAVVKISEKGRISYSVRLVGLDSRVTGLTLETPPNKRGKSKKVLKLTSQYRPDGDTHDGWANGTTDRIKAKEFHSLVQGKLNIRVQTEFHTRALHGDLVPIPSPNYGVETIGTPFVMTGKQLDPPVTSSSAALAWLTVDPECKLQYQIYLGGMTKSIDGSLMVQFRNPSSRDPTFPLNNFRKTLSGGILTDASAELMNAINAGDVTIEVTSKSHPNGILSTKVHIPTTCGEMDPDVLREEQYAEYDNEYLKREHTNCLFDNHLYNDGESWIPSGSNKTCTTCSCKTGKILCHAVACPKPDCDKPIRLKDSCCLQCAPPSAGATQCQSPGDNRFHYEDHLWHPYVPPFGYSQCAVCFCKSGSGNDYDCRKLACPKLDCPDSVAIRKNAGDCCKVCPFFNDTGNALSDPGARSEVQGDIVTGECRFQGQIYPPGAKWNPYVHPFGTVKCVICSCKDGKVSCSRKKCDCKTKTDRLNSCCQKTCTKGKKRKSKKRKNKNKRNLEE